MYLKLATLIALMDIHTSLFGSADPETDVIVQKCSSHADDKSLIGSPRRSFLADCVVGSSSGQKKMKTSANANDKLIAVAETAVANNLKDPSSARFRGVNYVERSHAVCGEINAKNSYGAYIGFRLFFVNESGEPFIAQDPSEIRGANPGERLTLLTAASRKVGEMKDACAP